MIACRNNYLEELSQRTKKELSFSGSLEVLAIIAYLAYNQGRKLNEIRGGFLIVHFTQLLTRLLAEVGRKDAPGDSFLLPPSFLATLALKIYLHYLFSRFFWRKRANTNNLHTPQIRKGRSGFLGRGF